VPDVGDAARIDAGPRREHVERAAQFLRLIDRVLVVVLPAPPAVARRVRPEGGDEQRDDAAAGE
jgi:hypothetical protein